MQTSYAFISVYKQRIAALDRAIQSASRQHQQNQQQQRGHRNTGAQGPIVEHRKLVSRLRQFLAEEEKFWAQLVVRMRRSYGLDEAQAVLTALDIIPSEEPTPSHTGDTEAAPHNRNQHQFPPEDPAQPVTPTTPEERASRLVVTSKALVCLGDLARYRESFKDGGGRDSRRGGRRGRGGMPDTTKTRNFSRAQLCYEKARLLAPYDGNASHQLAILASYEKDIFSSLVHYYRALCLQQPYETAAENFGTVLNKALEQWRLRLRRERERGHTREPSAATAAAARADAFKDRVVVLHALWRLNIHKMDTLAPGQARMVADEFRTLVSDRILSPEVISRLVVLSEGALWKHRMLRDSNVSSKKPDTASQASSASSSSSNTAMEARIFTHLLSVHQVLLEVGLIESAEPPPTDAAEGDLAQHITAVFRRTLPALRIAGKWLRANFPYVISRYTSSSGTTSAVHADQTAGDAESAQDDATSNVAVSVRRFFEIYARFASALSRAFPPEKLPALKTFFEEDVEMRGFLPLHRLIGELPVATAALATESASGEIQKPVEEQVHPNVEQLMRIGDLLNDAKLITELEGSPLAIVAGRFVVHGALDISTATPTFSLQKNVPGSADSSVNPIPPASQQKLMDEIRNESLAIREGIRVEDDSLTENTSRTDDDPVGDAFRQVLGDEELGDEDEDEDEIVWNPR
ncbi:hypothetical protein HGRIS_012057 [Hohenbuehelia grisea]|uniref:Uncharacterized protein n=1 Tax=Hohenbuehelia grisea TaxID=104357 RepID=A0ABR3IR55_9AGAR